jgi:predicted transcriptional regulator
MEGVRLSVLRVLHKEPPLSMPEIEQQVDYKRPLVEYQIQLLIDDGYVVVEGNGKPKYRITSPGERELRRCRISATIGFNPCPDS